MSSPNPLTTARAAATPDVLAPDGSEIRLLPGVRGASFCQCTLPPGRTSLAVRHRTVEEVWYCLAGRGEVWRRSGEHEDVAGFTPGVALTIPLGAEFQFRALGAEPLTFVIATAPPWPGPEEAVRVPDHWPVETGQTHAAQPSR